MNKLLVFCVFVQISESELAKILGVFPIPSISHQIVFRPLMQELAKRGHEITVITTDPAFPEGESPQNFTEIDVHDISYSEWRRTVLKNREKRGSRLKILEFVLDLMTKIFQIQLHSFKIQELLAKNENFDLLIYESCLRPAIIFSHIFNVPAIQFSSLSALYSTFEMIGGATHPLLYPDPMHRKIYNLTMWEKISELYIHYASRRIYFNHEYVENAMLRGIFGPNIPSLNDMAKNVQMLFLNVHPLWDFNRPVPPNVLYLGGLHQMSIKELPNDIKSYLDESKNGVIYVSFGTNVTPSLMPAEIVKIFTKVFSRLPYNVIWKWDKDELPGCPPNVMISKWLPQSDLLRHPNVKLFITQGGLQSTDEALTAGVPLIGIPMNGDQWLNTEQYIKFDIGIQLGFKTLTVDQLKDAIETVFDNDRFRENMIALRKLMNDQPQTAIERAVWWTEHVLRHGKDQRFQTPVTRITWVQYYELELVLVILISVTFVIICVSVMVYYIVVSIKYYFSSKFKVD